MATTVIFYFKGWLNKCRIPQKKFLFSVCQATFNMRVTVVNIADSSIGTLSEKPLMFQSL